MTLILTWTDLALLRFFPLASCDLLFLLGRRGEVVGVSWLWLDVAGVGGLRRLFRREDGEPRRAVDERGVRGEGRGATEREGQRTVVRVSTQAESGGDHRRRRRRVVEKLDGLSRGKAEEGGEGASAAAAAAAAHQRGVERGVEHEALDLLLEPERFRRLGGERAGVPGSAARAPRRFHRIKKTPENPEF